MSVGEVGAVNSSSVLRLEAIVCLGLVVKTFYNNLAAYIHEKCCADISGDGVSLVIICRAC